MNRTTAEQLLLGNDKVGSYLVRESDRKKGLFVLSYAGESGINHFQIKSLFGAYYIGGRQFSSLRHLIGFYTSFCDLLKKERLLHPVVPKEVEEIFTNTHDNLVFSSISLLFITHSDCKFYCYLIFFSLFVQKNESLLFYRIHSYLRLTN